MKMDKIDKTFVSLQEEKIDEQESACSSSILIKEEKLDKPESTCELVHVKEEEEEEEEIIISDNDINDSDCFIKEDKQFETESSLISQRMEDKKKKVIYSEKERILLKQCISASGLLTVSKQMDKVSNLQKEKAWEDITRNFNSKTENIPRTVNQLKKLWENMKFRRKADLAEPKRNIIRIGEVEIKSEKVEEELKKNEPSTMLEGKPEETCLKIKSDGKREIDDLLKIEAGLRIARVADQRMHEKELHELGMKEAKVKLQVAEAELDTINIRKELLLKELKKK